MRKTIYCSLAIILILGITACSNNKAQTEPNDKPETTETTEVDKGQANLDIEHLQKIFKQKDISADDCDFLLDQIELFQEQTEGMSKEERQKYVESRPQDEREALIMLGLGLSAAKKGGKLTDSQLKRYNELERKSNEK